ncbi:MAG: hypothetical protein GC185_07080 [Alphaproteobacteria bacterium]|nr:hypothetical protein [Alphaproteobacteria bacterium]
MRISIIFALLLSFIAAPARAATLDYHDFALLPVQHGGRVKPLAGFAASELSQMHGSAHMGGMDATVWLAQVLFDPVSAMSAPLFHVENPDVRAMLDLPVRPANDYSFADIMPLLQANARLLDSLLKLDEKSLTPAQQDVLQIYDNAGLFAQTARSMTLVLPLSLDLPKAQAAQVKKDGGAHPDFRDYFRHLPEWLATLPKGKKHAPFTDDEITLGGAVQQIQMIGASSQENDLLRVIPAPWAHDGAWLAPWAVFHAGQGSPATAKQLALWHEMAVAYQGHDAAGWRKASRALLQVALARPDVRPDALRAEVFYNGFDPLGKAVIFYALGLALALSGFAVPRRFRRRAFFAAIGAVAAGAACHALAIGCRVYILERPPVGTLYESLLFVGLVCVAFGGVLEWRMRNGFGIFASAVAGIALLLMSQTFAKGEDTMSVLVAVLNTNFWLATHVLCITTGYGFGIVAALVAHVWLALRAFLKRDDDLTRQLMRGAYATSLIALMFTTVGTILGGIWADQSWGRFWGWDPKENGALLICLWLIWLLHGRISASMKEDVFAAGLALLNVVIGLSWLGVNLLSVGLHSYGFTNQAAFTLAALVVSELGFAGAALFLLRGRQDARPA